jgi:molybdate transport system substrate-binding protein
LVTKMKLGWIGRAAVIVAVLCAVFGFAASTGSNAGGAPASTVELTVSAAISLKDALDEVRQVYMASHPDVSLAMNYGASGTLELQIEQGAPVDVFVPAAPQQMDALMAKGLLLGGTKRDLLRNEIVLIAPRGSTDVNNFQDLLKPSVKHVALGEPAAVPAGKYAQEVLQHFSIANQVNAKAVLAKDVRQVLTYVERGDADAGIVYATDALSSTKVRVVARAPAGSHAAVIYPVAVMSYSRHTMAAEAFKEFLFAPQAQAIFRKYGFELAGR